MDNRTIFAFLGGAAIGAGAALLFAPRTGDETRQQIRQTLDGTYTRVASLPPAVTQAAARGSAAARDAFVEAYQANTRA